MDLTGTVKLISNEVQVTEKFRKREFVITDESKYPQDVLFQLAQDRVDLLDKYKVGDKIKVYFNIRGREWVSPKGEVKHFNTLEAWRIENMQKTAPSEPQQDQAPIQSLDNNNDDLPF